MSTISYKGTRWYKCDLHLHTSASKCFIDEDVTAEMWVEKAIEKGLDCVAVTDHNTAGMIDEIKEAAKAKGLTVFPGVEITCDTAKIHLLVYFDTDKGKQEVEDFLITCGVDRTEFGEQNAATAKSIFDIAKIADEMGAMVIPAHIDEYSGLGVVSSDNLEKFFALDYINAVQLVHPEFLDSNITKDNYSELVDKFSDSYGEGSIDESIVKQWHNAARHALSNNQAVLAFSDNPSDIKSSKHGLFGIGSNYTWIKMDETPSLEGLRQAFLLSKIRVKGRFESPDRPYDTPDLWIKSLKISNTHITDDENPLVVDFSPQLTTIIGGRGSGKSSILRFIRGVLGQKEELDGLEEIQSDQENFYKRYDRNAKNGVLTEQSTVEIEFVRSNVIHKITATNITDTSQEITIQKFNSRTASWEEIENPQYIMFFELEQYAQKQIYEIAQEPNSLISRIDKAIPAMQKLKEDRDMARSNFLEKSASIRTISQQISNKERLMTELRDLEDRIFRFNESGISALIAEKEKYKQEEVLLNSLPELVLDKENQLNQFIEDWQIEEIDFSDFHADHVEKIVSLTKSTQDKIRDIKSELTQLSNKITQIREEYEDAIQNSAWKLDYDSHLSTFNQKKAELEQEGINDLSNFEALSSQKSEKEEKIRTINEIESTLTTEQEEKAVLKSEYIDHCKKITKARKEFVDDVLNGQKVKININAFRNRADFVQRLRSILKKETGFQNDIDALSEICFSGNVEVKIRSVKDKILRIKKGESVDGIRDTRFLQHIRSLSDSDIDELDLMMPEDEVNVKYKPENSNAFKPLSTASAGQKTTAILTFILSYGDVPLILDQPEDDLDNKLVYELIVDSLKETKENRQIIIVTHNANIPVNGDAEYIVSMNSESKRLQVLCTGSVEDSKIKKEVCDVMEGSEYAFQMRSKRYQFRN